VYLEYCLLCLYTVCYTTANLNGGSDTRNVPSGTSRSFSLTSSLCDITLYKVLVTMLNNGVLYTSLSVQFEIWLVNLLFEIWLVNLLFEIWLVNLLFEIWFINFSIL